jgi:rRNA-processing protein FCF1
MGIIYDTGALIAAENRRLDVWALHKTALRNKVRSPVPVAVLAQTLMATRARSRRHGRLGPTMRPRSRAAERTGRLLALSYETVLR